MTAITTGRMSACSRKCRRLPAIARAGVGLAISRSWAFRRRHGAQCLLRGVFPRSVLDGVLNASQNVFATSIAPPQPILSFACNRRRPPATLPRLERPVLKTYSGLRHDEHPPAPCSCHEVIGASFVIAWPRFVDAAATSPPSVRTRLFQIRRGPWQSQLLAPVADSLPVGRRPR